MLFMTLLTSLMTHFQILQELNRARSKGALKIQTLPPARPNLNILGVKDLLKKILLCNATFCKNFWFGPVPSARKRHKVPFLRSWTLLQLPVYRLVSNCIVKRQCCKTCNICFVLAWSKRKLTEYTGVHLEKNCCKHFIDMLQVAMYVG